MTDGVALPLAQQVSEFGVLGALRALDEVAYLRSESVYRGFESLADFEARK